MGNTLKAVNTYVLYSATRAVTRQNGILHLIPKNSPRTMIQSMPGLQVESETFERFRSTMGDILQASHH